MSAPSGPTFRLIATRSHTVIHPRGCNASNFSPPMWTTVTVPCMHAGPMATRRWGAAVSPHSGLRRPCALVAPGAGTCDYPPPGHWHCTVIHLCMQHTSAQLSRTCLGTWVSLRTVPTPTSLHTGCWSRVSISCLFPGSITCTYSAVCVHSVFTRACATGPSISGKVVAPSRTPRSILQSSRCCCSRSLDGWLPSGHTVVRCPQPQHHGAKIKHYAVKFAGIPQALEG